MMADGLGFELVCETVTESWEDIERRSHALRMRKTRATNQSYNEREKQRRTSNHASNRPPDIFKGADCEGAPGRVNLGEMAPLVLFRMGDDYLTESASGKGINWHEALDWMCHRPKEYTYVGFSFDYDVATILATYPYRPDLAKLAKTKLVYLRFGQIGWAVEYIPRKHFKVWPIRWCENRPANWCSTTKSCKYCGREPDLSRGRRIIISDVYANFQSSFVKAIEGWETGTESEREAIAHGKDSLRENISFYDPDEIAAVIEYNRLECEHLAELMTKFATAWRDAGLYPPRNWEGAGALAKRVFGTYQVPTRKELEVLGHIPKEVQEASALAMYGGWFETQLFGPVSGPITEFDLTSAYPDAFTKFPCKRHLRIEHRPPRGDEFALQYVRATYTRPVTSIVDHFLDADPVSTFVPDWRDDPGFPLFMGLPHRDKNGSISRPLNTTGWYWSFEIREARHQNIEVLDSWTIVGDQKCDCKYLRENMVSELFHRRQQLGKKRSRPLKYALNSMYGVLAQQKRGKNEPPYLDYLHASFITAWTRARIMRLIHEQTCERGLQCGHGVVMIATDAVFFQGVPDIASVPVEDKDRAQLGEWTREVFPNGLFIVQGGVYWPPGTDQAHSKTRGIPVSMLYPHIREFENAYRLMVKFGNMNLGTVTINKRQRADGTITDAIRFVGLTEAAHRHAWGELATFQLFSRDVGFDWTNKRERLPIAQTPDEPIRTIPKAVDDSVSVARKDIVEQFFGESVPKNASDDVKIDWYLDDTPDWLPGLNGTAADEGFDLHGTDHE